MMSVRKVHLASFAKAKKTESLAAHQIIRVRIVVIIVMAKILVVIQVY